MILLTGHSLTPARKVPVESMNLTLNERESTANFTPTDMTGISVNSWMQDDKKPGAGIVWRVESILETYATKTPKVNLEHMINSLRDIIIFGKVTAKEITGTNAENCTALQAVRYILQKQSDWVLGQFDYGNISNPYRFDGDTLYDALEYVSNSLPDAWWSYDFSVYPFRLNITRRDDSVGSQLRANRNLSAITKTIDKNGMFTRFYPIGKEDLHISGDYVEKNTSIYGVISKVETDQNRETEAELRAWANEKLENHAEPKVTVNVTALELAEATGEALDALQLGRKCRIPLPEYETTILETITQITYQDKVHQPEVAQITLANTRADITKIIAEVIKQGGAGGRAAARKEKEDHAWFEDTNNHVAMVAEGIVGKDASGNPNWGRLSQIIVNGKGIDMSVQSLQGDMVNAQTKIKLNEQQIKLEATRAANAETTLSSRLTIASNAITAEVTRATTAESTLSGRITVAADAITAEVTRATTAESTLSGRITVAADAIKAEVTRATIEEGTLSGRVTVEENKIALVVSEVSGGYEVNAASIVLGINSQDTTSQSYVDISADKINLTGYTTVSELYAVDAKIDNLMSGATTAVGLRCGSFSCNAAQFTLGLHTVWKDTVTIAGTTLNYLKWG